MPSDPNMIDGTPPEPDGTVPPPPNPPAVRPAPPWAWTGTVSALLVAAEKALEEARAIDRLPGWASVLVAAAPVIIRIVRERITRTRLSYRAVK